MERRGLLQLIHKPDERVMDSIYLPVIQLRINTIDLVYLPLIMEIIVLFENYGITKVVLRNP